MRNLKKFLALVLAMVMAFSLMLSASAADVKYDDYKDKDSVTPEFSEAVSVLTGLGVVQGDGEEGNKNFRPGEYITRAEAAAMVYRIVTGDVEGKQVQLYSDYGKFTDVNSGDWFAGYVGYCQNAGYIKGTTPTTFSPYLKVTGYEALAMILRAVGYGKNNEFVGSQWQVNVAALSKQLGVTRDVVSAHMDQTLNRDATREVVADLLFMTAATVPTVEFTPALAYNDKQGILGNSAGTFNPTLGQKVFGLFHDLEWRTVDKWGHPGYCWYQNGSWDGTTTTTAAQGMAYMTHTGHPVYTHASVNNATWRSTNLVATIRPDADLTFTELKRECDVAHELDFDDEETFELFVNGRYTSVNGVPTPNGTPLTDEYRVVATDTVTRVGGEGRKTEFYYELENKWFDSSRDNWAVMVDTFLAKVTNKTDAKLDAAGHVITPAQLYVDLYDKPQERNSTRPNPSKRVIQKSSTSTDNWEYAVGDYVLLNAFTEATEGIALDAVAAVGVDNGRINHEASKVMAERAAYERQRVAVNNAAQGANTREGYENASTRVCVVTNADVLQKVEPVIGKQTLVNWNTGKHTVESTEYTDQLDLYLDVAGTTINTNFAWYLDQYGKLIGVAEAPNSVQYGVIESIYYSFNQGESSTNKDGQTIAHVRYADNTEADVVISKFLTSSYGTNKRGSVNKQRTATENSLALTPVYDDNTGANTMKIDDRTNLNDGVARYQSKLYVSPVAATNEAREGDFPGGGDFFGIIRGNLFKFVDSSNGTKTAIEVGGLYDSDNHGNENTGVYEWMYNKISSDGASVLGGRLYKSLGYIALDVDEAQAAAGDNVIYLESDAKIMVRTKGTKTIKVYNGLSELPADIIIGAGSNGWTPTQREIDWADTDGNRRADVVYLTGEADGIITYNLFYFNANGGAGSWNGTTGTLTGYLNGEASTVTFNDYNEFRAVRDTTGYAGNLFALKIIDGVVSDVMQIGDDKDDSNDDTNWTANLLMQHDGTNWVNNSGEIVTSTGTFASIAVSTAKTTDVFPTTTPAANNPGKYTANSRAVYLDDTGSNVTYDYTSNTITAAGVGTFYLTNGFTKVNGDPLEYLNTRVNNDVTIVYEQGAVWSVTQVYVATDPDWTPVTMGVTDALDITDNIPANIKNPLASGPARSLWLRNMIDSGYITVPFCVPNIDMSSGQNIGINTAQNIYLPYTVGTSGANVTLTITDRTGATVYTETASTVAAGGHFFYVNVVNGALNTDGSGSLTSGSLARGEYYYTITGTYVNSGFNGYFNVL